MFNIYNKFMWWLIDEDSLNFANFELNAQTQIRQQSTIETSIDGCAKISLVNPNFKQLITFNMMSNA